MKKLLLIIITVAAMFACFSQSSAMADTGKMIIISIDNLEWDDLKGYELSNLEYIVKKGSAAHLNPIANGVRSRDNALFTLTTGKPHPANKDMGFIMGVDETIYARTAGEVFEFYTGRGSAGSIVHLGWKAVSSHGEYGALGDLLREHNIKSLYFSNADNDLAQRSMGNLFITSQGYGNPIALLSEPLVKKKKYLSVSATDYELLASSLVDYFQQLDLFVFELTEFLALDQMANSLTSERYYLERLSILTKYDYLLGQILELINPTEDLIIIFNPAPNQVKISKRDFLTPIIFHGKGYQDGLLISSTTKRAGLVVNYDLIPTIQAFFNLPASIGIGRAITAVNSGQGMEKISLLEHQYSGYLTVFRERPAIIKTYVFMQIAIVSTTLIAIVVKGLPKKIISLGLITLIVVPLSLLLTAPINFSLWAILLCNFTLSALLVAAIWFLEKKVKLLGFLCISAATTIAIFFDVLNNSYLIKQSFLGYDPIAGARYYGIGNEYMGVFIGASLMAVALAIQLIPKLQEINYQKALVLIVALLTIGTIGAPSLGTNVGGTIAAIFGFTYLTFWIFENSFKVKYLMALPLAVPLVLMLIFLVDMNRAVETQSHIGRTAALVKENGIWELVNIIQRKISMNIKLIKYTHWSRVFLVILGSMVFLFYKPPGLLAKILSDNPGLRTGVIAVIIASFAALAFNDSGIVAAATMMVYGAIPLLFRVISE